MFPPSGRQCPGEHVMLAEIREREPKGGTGGGVWRAFRPSVPSRSPGKSEKPVSIPGLILHALKAWYG